MTTRDTAAPPTFGDSITPSHRISIMTALVISTVMAALDSSFVPLAFSDMIDKLDTSTSRIVWVALGYLIAATGPMIFLSRLSETVGQIRLFQIGTAIYAGAMVACAWAPDIFWFIVLRVIQGFGMALFLPSTFALGTQVYPAAHMGRALGILQAANAAGFVLGPLFAGWLLDAFDWRAIFWSRIPLGVIAIAMSVFAFGIKTPSFAPLKKREYFDVAGAVLLTMALFGLLFGANRLPVEDNHLDSFVWLVFIAGFVAFALFLRQERRSPDPLVDLDLYKNSQTFSKASVAFTAMFASFPVYLFVLPLLLIMGLEMRAWDVGLVMCSGALATQIVSPFAGRWGDRFGAQAVSFVGTILVAVGYLGLLFINVNSEPLTLYVPMIIMGFGSGLFFAPNNSLIMGSVPPERASMASGMIGTLRQAGYGLGFAIIASLFTAIQDVYEANLTYFSLNILDVETAHVVSELFDGGGIWSPEIIIYIFRITVIISTAVLLWPLITSIPRFTMKRLHHLGTSAAAIGAAVFGTLLYIGSSDLTPSGATGETARSQWRTYEPVRAFGMQSRSVEIATLAMSEVDGSTVFMDNCGFCHGGDARGIDQLGVDLVGNSFIADLTDGALKDFIMAGRPEDAPDNITGNMMPAIDYLEDDEYTALMAYLRQINDP